MYNAHPKLMYTAVYRACSFFTNLDLFCIDNARVIYRKIVNYNRNDYDNDDDDDNNNNNNNNNNNRYILLETCNFKIFTFQASKKKTVLFFVAVW